jgi:hypothetical protein
MTSRHARRIALAAVAGSALLATACGGTTAGKGSTASGFPAASAPTPGAAGGGSCVAGAGYCDTFSDTSTGWAVENKPHFFAGYDKYLGGTYRVGERTSNTVSERAPVDIATVSADDNVQVDVDAALAPTMPAGGGFGLTCWEHASKDGASTSAFVFQVTSTDTSIGLWSATDGAYHDIVSEKTPGPLKPAGTRNHVTATCVRVSAGGSQRAQLSIAVNGAAVAAVTYAKSVKSYPWDVGPHVGLLASGQGSDIFYDNFALTAK